MNRRGSRWLAPRLGLSTLILLLGCRPEGEAPSTALTRNDAAPTTPVSPSSVKPMPRADTGTEHLDLVQTSWDASDRTRGAVLVHDLGSDRDSRILGVLSDNGWAGLDQFSRRPGRMSTGSFSRLQIPLPAADAPFVGLRLHALGATWLDVYLNHHRLVRLPLRPGEPTAAVVSLPRELMHKVSNQLVLVPNLHGIYPNAPDLHPAFTLETASFGIDQATVLARVQEIAPRTPSASGVLQPLTGRRWILINPHEEARVRLVATSPCKQAKPTLSWVREADLEAPLQRDVVVADKHTSSELALGLGRGVAMALTLKNLDARCAITIESLTVSSPKAPALPNVPASPRGTIVVLVDTLRADRTAASPSPHRPPTPAHDRIAREGLVFSDVVSTSNWTLPAIASLFTGAWTQVHGVVDRSRKIPDSLPLLSERLREQGVATAAFAANSFFSATWGFERGWNHFKNYGVDGTTVADAKTVFRDGTAWIDSLAPGQRFFLYLHTYDPHTPYTPSRAFPASAAWRKPIPGLEHVDQVNAAELDRIRRGAIRLPPGDEDGLIALYDGEVIDHDRWFGDFLAGLDRRGLLSDTLLVFVSDHGEELHDHGSWGHDHGPYQELLHVPLMLRYGTALAGAAPSIEAASLVDLHTTLARVHGVPAQAGDVGRNLLVEQPLSDRVLPRGRFAVTSHGDRLTYVGRYKRVEVKGLDDGGELFYDLVRDPKEELLHALPIAYRALWLVGRPQAHAEPSPVTTADPALADKLRALGYAN